jgi:hypothetical protein
MRHLMISTWKCVRDSSFLFASKHLHAHVDARQSLRQRIDSAASNLRSKAKDYVAELKELLQVDGEVEFGDSSWRLSEAHLNVEEMFRSGSCAWTSPMQAVALNRSEDAPGDERAGEAEPTTELREEVRRISSVKERLMEERAVLLREKRDAKQFYEHYRDKTALVLREFESKLEEMPTGSTATGSWVHRTRFLKGAIFRLRHLSYYFGKQLRLIDSIEVSGTSDSSNDVTIDVESDELNFVDESPTVEDEASDVDDVL